MSNVGGCEQCGRRFRRHDFRCDEIGRALLVHRCRAEDIRAYHERLAREAATAITIHETKFCRRCERPFEPASPVQLRCRLCIPIYNRARDRRRIAAARQRGAA